MKNYVQPGDVLTLTAPYQRNAGEMALIGAALIAVANTDIANGANGEWSLEGVFTITALSTDTGSVGAKMYWDNTNKRLTTTSAGNTLVGVLTVAKLNGDTTAQVRLNAAFT